MNWWELWVFCQVIWNIYIYIYIYIYVCVCVCECVRLFPFSLAGKANECLIFHPNQSLTKWKDVEEIFLQRFFPIFHYIKAKSEISMFRQGAAEFLCVT